MIYQFELRLSNGKTVIWDGKNGVDAAMRYVSAHNEKHLSVIAWRSYPRKGLFYANYKNVTQ